jgi:hypothetical protein
MRRFERVLATFLFFIAAPTLPLRAATCALDGGPAATLLLPYFEVDLAVAGGRTTLLSINNAREQSTLAHVVLWTDLAVPTLIFDVFLTGWDVQTINLRDVFEGRLPRTADAGHDPQDNISPQGAFSLDGSFPGCSSLPPQNLSADVVGQLRRAHTGQSPLLNGQCVGIHYTDGIVARGYATIDVVKSCTALRPGDAGYFGPSGVAASDNVLWGDFFYVDPDGRFAQGNSLVRIEADPERFGPGDLTFYGRYVNGSGADVREPLPAAWAARFLNGGAFDGGTDLVVWRSLPLSGQSHSCGTLPPGVPRSQKTLLAFDEKETVDDVNHPPPPPITTPPPPIIPYPFPLAAVRGPIVAALPLVFDFGWLQMDFRPREGETADPYAQAWVGQIHSAQGRYSVGLDATPLDSGCAAERCSQGTTAGVGHLCVLGPLQAGQPARFQVRPQGCFSSTCTFIFQAGCAVERNGSELRLDGLFCLGNIPVSACTPDCGGGGFAECSSGALAAGIYTAKLGGLELAFTVPSATGGCVGNAF